MSSYSRSRFRSIEIVAGPALGPTIGLAVLGLFAQSVFAQLLTFRAAVPSFVCIAVVLYAAKAGARRGALLGLIAGVLEDSFAVTGGGWTIATTLVALGVGGIGRTVFADGFIMPSVLVALAVLARDAVFWAIMSLEGYPRGFATAHLHAALWQAAMSSGCAMLYLILRGRFITDRTAVERYP